MRSVNYSLVILFLPVFLYCQPDFMQQPVSTYSIVARDTVTGEIGVAVQSHFFSAGSIVPWAEVVRRLPASGLLPVDDELVQTLVEMMKR